MGRVQRESATKEDPLPPFDASPFSQATQVEATRGGQHQLLAAVVHSNSGEEIRTRDKGPFFD